MSPGAWLDLDLLRQRRQDYGQDRPRVQPTGSLLRQGALIGSVVPLALLLLLGWFVFRDRWLAGEIRSLQPASEEHEVLQQRLISTQAQLNALEIQNQTVAKALSDVRSSSALLTELQRIIPNSLELKAVSVQENSLILQGQAMPKGGLRAVNAFLLRLKGSSFLDDDSVMLVNGVLNGLPDQPRLDYELKASFASDAAQASADRLAALGARGMALRVALMQREGLLP